LARFQHNYPVAAFHALRATWKCEDIQHPLRGVIRQQALDCFILAIQHNQTFAASASEQLMIIADIARRHGEFNMARQYHQQALQAQPPDSIRAALDAQAHAIEQNNMLRVARPHE
jgi:hypothetical protein